MAEWLPEDHLARFVIGTVDELDLGAVYAAYRQDGRGRAAHDPKMMVGLVLYAYAIGVTTSRAIERRCVDDVAFRVISGNRQPDHATIARFLVRHQAAISDLFFDVLALCQQAGMINVGTVAVDSTKLAANASAAQNRTYDGLRAGAQRIVGEAIKNDRREDELYGDKRGDELPDELADPRTRKARIKQLLEQARREREAIEAEREQMHAREAERQSTPVGQRRPGRRPRVTPSDKQQRVLTKKYNVTDPDSVVVRNRGMLLQGYNVQAAVADGQVILAARATSSSPDGGQLEPMIDAAQQSLARIGQAGQIERVLADTGYWSDGQVARLSERGMRVLVPPYARATGHGARQMRAVLAQPDGQQDYQRRQQIIEPVFAHWKHIRQITRVWRRGRQAVQAEIDLIATSHNLLKLYRAIPAVA